MAENKNIENTRIIEDSDLNNVSGGLSAQDYQDAGNDIVSVLKGVGLVFEKFTDMLQQIQTAMDTNICPICNQSIVPLAEKCELMDFVQHVKIAHSDKQ